MWLRGEFKGGRRATFGDHLFPVGVELKARVIEGLRSLEFPVFLFGFKSKVRVDVKVGHLLCIFEFQKLLSLCLKSILMKRDISLEVINDFSEN